MSKATRTIFFLNAIIILLTLPLPAAALSPPDPRFGAIETYDAPDAAAEMSVGWTRVPFLWAQMQPNGTHEWISPISDETLALEIAQGRQPVGLVITTPGWATDMNIGPGVPYGLHTGHNDPNNLWANFLQKLVSTYAGRIDHWIIWNEPDVWDPAHPGYTWGGSVEDFLQLQRVAYLTIKETNPNAQVIFSGTSYWWDAAHGRDLYFRRYLDALVQDLSAPGNNYYCDAVALHVYFQPDFVYSITALYHQLMREHGFDKPIWIVETNAAPSLDPHMPATGGQFAITLEEQAAYIIQAFAMGIAGGAARLGVFKMIDTPTDLAANPEPFGLVRADGSRRPAFNTYHLATTYLAGFQDGQLEQRDDVSIVTISRAGGTTTVLWTRTPSPATVQVPARANSATLVDMWGNRRAISASGGIYSVSLPGATCTQGPPCLIGGPPLMIVEGSVTAKSSLTNTVSPPTPTRVPTYTVNLQATEVADVQKIWEQQALRGYQIELIVGPPFHLYQLTVAGDTVTRARRSREPLNIKTSDWPTQALTDTVPAPALRASAGEYPWNNVELVPLPDQLPLAPYTVAGLFRRVMRYFQSGAGPWPPPDCDTQVTVQFEHEWALPRRIVEHWAKDCQAQGQPREITVVAFATLTPTPTPTLTPSPTATAAPTLTATRPKPTSTATPLPIAPPTAQQPTATPASRPATGSAQPLVWLFLIASALVVGTVLIRRNGKDTAGPPR